MTAAELAGAAEILVRLAKKLDSPGKDGWVRIPVRHEHYGALQQLLRGTQWDGRYCWEHVGSMSTPTWYDAGGTLHCGDTILCVNTRPPPRYCACQACGGEGRVLVNAQGEP